MDGHGWFDVLTLLLGILGLVAAVGGVYLSIVALRDGKKLDLRLDELAKISQALTGEVATRAIGRFPENISALVDLISRTEKHLLIATDVAAYGQLSNAHDSGQYIQAITKCARGNIPVRMVVLSGDVANREREQQFSEFTELGEPGLKKLLTEQRWLDFATKHRLQNPTTFQAFFAALASNDHESRRSMVSAGVFLNELNDVNVAPAVYFWIKDNNEAIFSLFTQGEKAREISFRTKDSAIIQMLSETFKSVVIDSTAMTLT